MKGNEIFSIPDIRMITNKVDTVVLAVDNVDHAIRASGLLKQGQTV